MPKWHSKPLTTINWKLKIPISKSKRKILKSPPESSAKKITNLENLSEKIQNLIENDSMTNRGKLNGPAVGGSKVDYPTAALLGATKADVELMKDRTTEIEEHFSLLEQVAQQRATKWRITPNIWPVKGAITSHYGERLDPFNGDEENHLGLDISALYGAQVRAPADGKVIYAQRMAAYGNLLIIDHGNGLTTRYGHLSRFIAKVGQKVKKSDVVALVGNTGRTTAPHLHYEVRLNDRPTNPRDYLPKG